VLGETYRLILGENPPAPMPPIKWAINLGFMVVVFITSLNLLITIISNQFEDVLADQVARNIEIMTEIIYMNE